MTESKIGVTLYNLREHCKTESDLARTLERVRKIGYEAVQVSGVSADISPETIKKYLDANGLYCCATHENLSAYSDKFDWVIEKLKTLDCSFTAIGSPGNDFWSFDGVVSFAGIMEEIGKKFKEQGVRFGFHNHHREFQRFGEKTFIEELYQRTNPQHVWAELDLHWIVRGGGDPIVWLENMKGRLDVIHFKDFTIVDSEPKFCEIGEGNMNWPGILRACEENGVRWYVVEQDQPFGERDIFESIKISYENMKGMGIQ